MSKSKECNHSLKSLEKKTLYHRILYYVPFIFVGKCRECNGYFTFSDFGGIKNISNISIKRGRKLLERK